ncbi:DUF2892 domain-containing protein [Urbifossiella limnaea]|uniref:DUF2892 domain-containing protein n=1 Tax=Urbifossiella limnaea TaxID=2528023 RepID=A0A517Y3S7_9BACT|nr:DUF2892 domain-containing protein [Urbifossiella limnaea]QDU24344.1 hypothetical protein ETAA1_63580 [Urbifossiella limnaea]
MLPSTSQRVPDQTAAHVNEAIRQRTRGSVERAAAGGVPAIDRRLAELDAEWDVERTLEANAATAAATGAALALLVDRRFAVLPLVVGGFLLQHALQGWCPPLPVFRRLGFRTPTEIDEERAALKALRGDYRGVGGRTPGEMAADALAAARG